VEGLEQGEGAGRIYDSAVDISQPKINKHIKIK
jgi:hypothetical protein